MTKAIDLRNNGSGDCTPTDAATGRITSEGNDQQPNRKSRTALALKNSRVALLFYIFEMLLGFVSRTVFIQYVGPAVLGLNTTATNLLQFLNLAELGIGTAVAFSLYKPLAEDDRQTVEEIVALQGWLYKRIAWIVMAGAAVLMCFFPMIFAKMDLPLWYAYASFGVLLYAALLTYFFNYKQVALAANQMQYKVIYSYKSVTCLRSVLQIVAMATLPNPYVWWLVIHAAMSTTATLALTHSVNKTFPFLRKTSTKVSREVRQKYKVIITKVKQLFFHKIGGYVLTQTSPLIIYAYVNLTMVAVYGNYMLIVSGLMMLTQAFFGGIAAGVGNLIATGDKPRIMSVFKEVFSSRFLISSTFCFTVFILADSFVVLWVGPEYLLDRNSLLVIVAILFINLMRTVVEHFIQGYGIFADIWAPIVEAIINIGLSVLLGYWFGITGILSGVLISLVIIVMIWKPYYLFTRGMKESLWIYLKVFMVHCFAFAIVAFGMYKLMPVILFNPTNFFIWGVNALTVIVLFGFTEWAILWLVAPEMRQFTQRVMRMLPIKKIFK